MNWTILTDNAARLAGPATIAAVCAATLVVLVGLAVAVKRIRRPDRVLAWVAAVIATGVSGTGMWLVADKALHLDGPLRAVLFGFAEIGLLSSAIRARRHHTVHGRGGPDAAAVWVIAAAAGAVSAMESTSLPEVAVRLTAPLLAAWLWHRGLHDTTTTGTQPREQITMRLSTRRILVALRLAEPGTVGLADVDRARRLNAVVAAAIRRDTATGDHATARAARRLERSGRRARGYLDPDGITYVRAALAAVYGLDHGVSRTALADLTPWQPTRDNVPTALGRVGLDDVASQTETAPGTELPTEAVPAPDPWQHATPVADTPPSDVPGTGRGSKPTSAAEVRTDAELLRQLADVPRRPDGTVPVRRAVAILGIGNTRAYRLLGQANLLAAPRRTGTPTEPGDNIPAQINGTPVPAATPGEAQ